MKQILIVDDEAELLRHLKNVLQNNHPDWIITEVPSAERALELIAQIDFDLIITDWLFSKEPLTGTDVLRAAKNKALFTMGIIISAYQGERMDRYRDGFACGAYDVIDKTNHNIDFDREVELKASAALNLRDECLARGKMGRHVDRRVVEAYTNPAALAFESRWLTILFCDVRGFSKINQELMAENHLMAAFLKNLYSTIVEVTDRRGGIVDKFMGDGAMLLFGAATCNKPQQSQQMKDACAAVYTALDLVREMEPVIGQFEAEFKAVSATLWEHLKLGVGIHSAQVLVGLIETQHRDQFTALGHGVNLAQRFESAAGRVVPETGEMRGSILISNPVRARIGDYFRLKDEGVLTGLRNIDGRQSAWSVQGEAIPRHT